MSWGHPEVQATSTVSSLSTVLVVQLPKTLKKIVQTCIHFTKKNQIAITFIVRGYGPVLRVADLPGLSVLQRWGSIPLLA